jgi:uncharacterized membrane protein HdeD (DUF308 family)
MTSTRTQSDPMLPRGAFPLLHALAENWWVLLLRGIAAIAFGVLAFIWPNLTLLTLIFLWGFYALVDGIIALWAAIASRRGGTPLRWWLAIVGIIGIAAGLVAFVYPGITAQVLLTFIAIWAIAVGLLQIWGAIQLRKEIESEWLLGLSGLISIAFGVLLLVRPGAGALALVWMIGWFAILIGCNYIALAFRLKQHKHPA